MQKKENISETYRGRIAPTPSGFLHIGHAQTFKTAFDRAKANCGKLVFRLEDVDKTRCKEIYAKAAINDLKAAGLTWDEGPDVGGKFAPYIQSLRTHFYISAWETLLKKNLIYPCKISRQELKNKASQNAFGEAVFPENLRVKNFDKNLYKAPDNVNWRFAVSYGQEVSFFDELLGEQKFFAGKDFGDFLIWRKEGFASYELAVVCDDIAMQITEVVRGEDLLLSTARQILIYKALGKAMPKFCHCPLIKDAEGKKISKSTLANTSGLHLRNMTVK